jgi:AraC family transcriptional regulator, arabinose operon regulatory protein
MGAAMSDSARLVSYQVAMHCSVRMKKTQGSSAYVAGGLRLDDDPGGSGARDLILRCCGYLPRNRNWNYSQVFSPFWRLYRNFGPGQYITHEGRSIPLLPGRFILIPENVLFHCHSASKTPGHLYIHFNLLPGRAPRLNAPVVIGADAVSTGIAGRLSRAITQSRPERVGHWAASLLHWLIGNLPVEHPIARLPSIPLQKALAWIEDHLGEDLSNAPLARVAGTSIRGLVRLFHDESHTTPQSYVREMRLMEAARRLTQGGDTIDQVAADLGFPNRFYFTRRFTRYLRQSPAEFRRRMQGKLNVS